MQTYTIKENKVFRKGKHVANIGEEGEVTLTDPEFSKYKAPIVRFITSQKEEKARRESSIDPDPEDVKDIAKKNLNIDSEEEAMKKEAEEKTEKGLSDIEDDKAFARRNGIELPPKRNPMYGDKTPSYVEWLFKYRREKFDRVFGVVGMGEIPEFDEEGNIMGYKKVLMAKRKCHLTERVERDETMDSDISWNAY